MPKSKTLLTLFVLLAAGWTGLLAYLAATVADPVVVSAPQLYLASLVVAAEVRPSADGEVEAKIIKVFKDDPRRAQPLPAMLRVRWIPAFNVPGQSTYLLALWQQSDQLIYEVRPLGIKKTLDNPTDMRVYPYTDSVRIQAERILSR